MALSTPSKTSAIGYYPVPIPNFLPGHHPIPLSNGLTDCECYCYSRPAACEAAGI